MTRQRILLIGICLILAVALVVPPAVLAEGTSQTDTQEITHIGPIQIGPGTIEAWGKGKFEIAEFDANDLKFQSSQDKSYQYISLPYQSLTMGYVKYWGPYSYDVDDESEIYAYWGYSGLNTTYVGWLDSSGWFHGIKYTAYYGQVHMEFTVAGNYRPCVINDGPYNPLYFSGWIKNWFY